MEGAVTTVTLIVVFALALIWWDNGGDVLARDILDRPFLGWLVPGWPLMFSLLFALGTIASGRLTITYTVISAAASLLCICILKYVYHRSLLQKEYYRLDIHKVDARIVHPVFLLPPDVIAEYFYAYWQAISKLATINIPCETRHSTREVYVSSIDRTEHRRYVPNFRNFQGEHSARETIPSSGGVAVLTRSPLEWIAADESTLQDVIVYEHSLQDDERQGLKKAVQKKNQPIVANKISSLLTGFSVVVTLVAVLATRMLT